MEFKEKLQELRKQKGLTQEELAKRLYVSRTAVSKWESGRGYPNLESLQAIAKAFSVTVDELLSSDELLTSAKEDGKQREGHFRDLIYGLLDLCMALLLFLPFFAERGGETVRSVSLLALDGAPLYLKIAYYAAVLSMVAVGVLILALQGCRARVWSQSKAPLSLVLGAVAVLIFTVSTQPYAAVFAFALLSVKAISLIKRH